MRESEMFWGEAYADAGKTIAEALRLRYPRRSYNRSLQFADYLKDLVDSWYDIPEYARIPFWFGCVHRWLDHPCEGEREMFEDAIEELTRLRMERICPDTTVGGGV
jgi:hypothetical protein